MSLQNDTKTFLRFLHANRPLRQRIRAAPNQTILYAGAFMQPAWKEIEALKRTKPEIMRGKQTLPDVLRLIPVPGSGYANLQAYAEGVQAKVPWKPDGFIVWRALSGIFASQATGKVSFCILGGVTRDEKVFAATELGVMLRNPNIDATSRDMLEYYRRCIQTKNADINVTYLSG